MHVLAAVQASAFTQEKKKADVSESALQSAIQRALPGVVAAHTGTGAASVRTEGAMGSGPSGRPVEMSDLPKATLAIGSDEGSDHDRPLSGHKKN